MQTAFYTLDEALKTTNRRVNALENVVKPKIDNTISYIKVGWSRRQVDSGAQEVGQGVSTTSRWI